jgi:hypothetical protein
MQAYQINTSMYINPAMIKLNIINLNYGGKTDPQQRGAQVHLQSQRQTAARAVPRCKDED